MLMRFEVMRGMPTLPIRIIGTETHGVTALSRIPRRAIRAQRNAIPRLAIGPARATSAMSRFGFLRFCQVTGTGLAQPKMAPPASIIRPGTRMVPSGSMCLRGFSVSLPIMRAVLSPKRFATHP